MAEQPKRVLTREELQRSVERLTQVTRPDPLSQLKPLPTATTTRTLSPNSLQTSVQRLYTDDLTRRQASREELLKKEATANGGATATRRVKLSAAEQDASVERLYTESIAHKSQMMKELWKREMQASSAAPRSKQTTTPGGGEGDGEAGAAGKSDWASRLYTESIEQKNQKDVKLYEKYVADREPKMPVHSKAEIAAACDKMYKGEGLLAPE